MAGVRRTVEPDAISPLTVARLSIYLRCLEQLQEGGFETVSSQELADRFNLNSAQIRKDLAYFGEFGIRGVGYQVGDLRHHLVHILGLDAERRLVIVGAGNLGTALCHYSGFARGNVIVVGVLDSDPDRIGTPTPSGLLVEDAARLAQIVEQRNVQVGVITTPPASAQAVCDQMIDAGLRAVLNFAPVQVKSSNPDVMVKSVDLKIHLEELSFFLAGRRSAP